MRLQISVLAIGLAGFMSAMLTHNPWMLIIGAIGFIGYSDDLFRKRDDWS